MARLGRLGFLVIGVVFHIIYLYTIFDIYFVSPIVHGMRPYSVPAPAPAKRLFLIVGDGLRADKCFQSHPDPFAQEPSLTPPRPLAPFIRSKVLTSGTFGVSHTRVPTESRPGHVALIAGLYEDVSAVTTGWKLNPVNFDSVFNRSRHTWSWGSPDILPMFKEGASDNQKVDAEMYGEEMEDFTLDATALDTWVFDKVTGFFEEARTNATLNKMLQQDKLVFFLHLLGLDTTGHGFRPYSPEYLRNIKIVDDGVRRINNLVDEFYGRDGKTAWVFTADHGMSDWGSHGDGHPDNTRTPLVAWGAGVAKPARRTSKNQVMSGHEDGFSADWDLDEVKRVDVAQADIAALMAYLVGLEFPVNSVGELPLEYLDADPNTQAAAIYANARQILEMYMVKEEQKKLTTLSYTPYPPLVDLPRKYAEIEALLRMNAHHMAIEKSHVLTRSGLAGLRYLQTYDWLFLRTLVTLGYIGWIAFALTTVLDKHVLHNTTRPHRSFATTMFFAGVLGSLWTLFIMQSARPTYYAYAVFPVVFWEAVFVRRASVARGVGILLADIVGPRPTSSRGRKAAGGGKWKYALLLLQAAAGVALMEAVVLGYFYREVFTGCFLIAAGWPLCYGKKFIKQRKGLVGSWAACCLAMGTFTLFPAIKTDSEVQVLLGGFLMFVTGVYYIHYGDDLAGTGTGNGQKEKAVKKDPVGQIVLGIQTGLIALAMIVTSNSMRSIAAKTGVPLGNQVVGWLTLAASVLVPSIYTFAVPHSPASNFSTFMRLFLTFAPTFILLTISYEGLFYVSFTLLLHLWSTLESLLPTASTSTRLQLSDSRVALFFFFFLQSAFFSTGNIASISSFSLDSVYRLIPIFSPFAMGALLLWKLTVPFILISAVLGGIRRREGVFGVASAVSDVLTLNFFWMVRDEGSWLEIGTTISHFCIGGLLGVFVGALELGAGVFARGGCADVGVPIVVEPAKDEADERPSTPKNGGGRRRDASPGPPPSPSPPPGGGGNNNKKKKGGSMRGGKKRR